MMIFRSPRHYTTAAMSLLRPGFGRHGHVFPAFQLFDDDVNDFLEAFESQSRETRRARLSRPLIRFHGEAQKTVEIPISNKATAAPPSVKSVIDGDKKQSPKNIKMTMSDTKHSTSDAKHSPQRSLKDNGASVGEGKASSDATPKGKPALDQRKLDIFSKHFSDEWFTVPVTSPSLLQKNEETNRYVYTLDNAFGDVKCSVRGNTMQIEGKSEHKSGSSYSMQSFTRSFTLPSNAEVDKVKAELADGRLSIDIPKSTATSTEQENTSQQGNGI
mmetsp:Transcript_30998/g.43425  ORF Transcript_30998/g.43425 Transcript_30998/m.43425 type:complete len:273 (+) Transcript_30998:87-905(+)